MMDFRKLGCFTTLGNRWCKEGRLGELITMTDLGAIPSFLRHHHQPSRLTLYSSRSLDETMESETSYPLLSPHSFPMSNSDCLRRTGLLLYADLGMPQGLLNENLELNLPSVCSCAIAET